MKYYCNSYRCVGPRSHKKIEKFNVDPKNDDVCPDCKSALIKQGNNVSLRNHVSRPKTRVRDSERNYL